MFENIVIKDIPNIFNVYSKKGYTEENKGRTVHGLSFCLKGKITYIQNGRKYISDEKCAVVLPKDAAYTIIRQETGYFPVINFLCDNFHTDKFITIPLNNPQILMKLFNELSEHFRYEEKLEVKSVFYRMLAEIDNNSKSDNATRAVKYIYENFGNPMLSNKKIAEYLNCSETYLNKQFMKDTGTTPKKFVQKIRMENAGKLLSEDYNTISEISEICGFSSIYSFSRAFRNYTQKSPSEYKKYIWSQII